MVKEWKEILGELEQRRVRGWSGWWEYRMVSTGTRRQRNRWNVRLGLEKPVNLFRELGLYSNDDGESLQGYQSRS